MSAALLFFFLCFIANTQAQEHQRCRSFNMTGVLSVMSLEGQIKAHGTYTYDATGRKIRFKSKEGPPMMNQSLELDLLVHFEEGIIYKIDSDKQTCRKKQLQIHLHPFEVPADGQYYSTIQMGSRTDPKDGFKTQIWTGPIPGTRGFYSTSLTMGCFPISTFYFTGPTTLLFSNQEIDLGVSEPDLLLVPSFCQNQPVEVTAEGKTSSFIHEFV